MNIKKITEQGLLNPLKKILATFTCSIVLPGTLFLLWVLLSVFIDLPFSKLTVYVLFILTAILPLITALTVNKVFSDRLFISFLPLVLYLVYLAYLAYNLYYVWVVGFDGEGLIIIVPVATVIVLPIIFILEVIFFLLHKKRSK